MDASNIRAAAVCKAPDNGSRAQTGSDSPTSSKRTAPPVCHVQLATFYVVPNINPDGSVRSPHRTNAKGATLNREWNVSTVDYSPEVHWEHSPCNVALVAAPPH